MDSSISEHALLYNRHHFISPTRDLVAFIVQTFHADTFIAIQGQNGDDGFEIRKSKPVHTVVSFYTFLAELTLLLPIQPPQALVRIKPLPCLAV